MSDAYKPKIVFCRLHMPQDTADQLREKLKGQGFTYREFQNMARSNYYFDNLELWVSLWNWDNHENWHLWNWQDKDNEKVMLAMYHAEQFHPYKNARGYKDNFEKFKADWESDQYDPGATFTFTMEQVEVLRVEQEEENNIEPGTVQKAVKQAKAERQRRYTQRKATKRSYRNRNRKRR